MGLSLFRVLASALPGTLLFFIIGVIILKKLKLTAITVVFGFFISWLISAFAAMIIADQLTANSSIQSVVPASFIGSIIGLVGIGIAGKRKAHGGSGGRGRS